MRASKLPQNHENEYGFAKLKPPHATEAHAHLGETEARDECCHHAQSRAFKVEAVLTCEQQMGWRGGRPPSPFCFFIFAKNVTFPGVFFIDVICVQKVSH